MAQRNCRRGGRAIPTKPRRGRDTMFQLRREFLLFVTTVALVSPQAVSAQVLYGSLVGNVRDASDAAVPGTAVIITNSETNFSRQVLTNEAGIYNFTSVPAGIYDLKVSREG